MPLQLVYDNGEGAFYWFGTVLGSAARRDVGSDPAELPPLQANGALATAAIAPDGISRQVLTRIPGVPGHEWGDDSSVVNAGVPGLPTIDPEFAGQLAYNELGDLYVALAERTHFTTPPSFLAALVQAVPANTPFAHWRGVVSDPFTLGTLAVGDFWFDPDFREWNRQGTPNIGYSWAEIVDYFRNTIPGQTNTAPQDFLPLTGHRSFFLASANVTFASDADAARYAVLHGLNDRQNRSFIWFVGNSSDPANWELRLAMRGSFVEGASTTITTLHWADQVGDGYVDSGTVNPGTGAMTLERLHPHNDIIVQGVNDGVTASGTFTGGTLRLNRTRSLGAVTVSGWPDIPVSTLADAYLSPRVTATGASYELFDAEALARQLAESLNFRGVHTLEVRQTYEPQHFFGQRRTAQALFQHSGAVYLGHFGTDGVVVNEAQISTTSTPNAKTMMRDADSWMYPVGGNIRFVNVADVTVAADRAWGQFLNNQIVSLAPLSDTSFVALIEDAAGLHFIRTYNYTSTSVAAVAGSDLYITDALIDLWTAGDYEPFSSADIVAIDVDVDDAIMWIMVTNAVRAETGLPGTLIVAVGTANIELPALNAANQYSFFAGFTDHVIDFYARITSGSLNRVQMLSSSGVSTLWEDVGMPTITAEQIDSETSLQGQSLVSDGASGAAWAWPGACVDLRITGQTLTCIKDDGSEDNSTIPAGGGGGTALDIAGLPNLPSFEIADVDVLVTEDVSESNAKKHFTVGELADRLADGTTITASGGTLTAAAGGGGTPLSIAGLPNQGSTDLADTDIMVIENVSESNVQRHLTMGSLADFLADGTTITSAGGKLTSVGGGGDPFDTAPLFTGNPSGLDRILIRDVSENRTEYLGFLAFKGDVSPRLRDEGGNQGNYFDILNFTGAGVTCSQQGTLGTCNIPGGGGAADGVVNAVTMLNGTLRLGRSVGADLTLANVPFGGLSQDTGALNDGDRFIFLDTNPLGVRYRTTTQMRVDMQVQIEGLPEEHSFDLANDDVMLIENISDSNAKRKMTIGSLADFLADGISITATDGVLTAVVGGGITTVTTESPVSGTGATDNPVTVADGTINLVHLATGARYHRGNWNSLQVYVRSQSVEHDGHLWVNALGSSAGDTPSMTSTVWYRIDHRPTEVQDQGTVLSENANIINFTGGGVTSTVNGYDVTVNIPGGGGAFTIHDLPEQTQQLATTDRIPLSDESANGDPNEYLTAFNFFSAIRDVINTNRATPLDNDRMYVTREDTAGDPLGYITVAQLRTSLGGGGGDDAYDWATEGNTDSVPTAKLGGTASDNTEFLRGDGRWRGLFEGLSELQDLQPTDQYLIWDDDANVTKYVPVERTATPGPFETSLGTFSADTAATCGSGNTFVDTGVTVPTDSHMVSMWAWGDYDNNGGDSVHTIPYALFAALPVSAAGGNAHPSAAGGNRQNFSDRVAFRLALAANRAVYFGRSFDNNVMLAFSSALDTTTEGEIACQFQAFAN